MITVYALISDNSDSSYSLAFFKNKEIVDGLLELDQFLCNEGSAHEFYFPDNFDFESANIKFSDDEAGEFYYGSNEFS